MKTVGYQLLGELASYNPNIKTNDTFWPFMSTLKKAVGGVFGVAFVICALTIVIGVLVIAWAKTSGSQRASNVSTGAVGWAILAAIVVGSASGIVQWGSGLDIGF